MSLLPAIPRIPPLWRESRIGLEGAALRRSPVYGGLGVPSGERRPVLLIPGFMAGDLSLGTMANWLRRAGYCTHRTGIRANFDCSEEACRRLEARLEHMAERHGERVIVIGQSRGGVFAKALAARRPELVEGIVTLGSPTGSPPHGPPPAAPPPPPPPPPPPAPARRAARRRGAGGAGGGGGWRGGGGGGKRGGE